MAHSDAHILRIPREIRDQIFSYVGGHEATFPWRWTYSGKGRLSFDVTIPHAPRLSILMTCSRLYEEHRQQCKAENMVLHWDGHVRKSHVNKRVNKNQMNIKAFSRVENIKVVVDLTNSFGRKESEAPWMMQGELHCNVVNRLFDFFAPRTARLSSIVIVSRRVAASRGWNTWTRNDPFTMRPEEISSGLVQDTLSGLRLVHFARALCLYSNIEHHNGLGWTDPYHSLEDSVYQLQVRYYAREPHEVLHPTPREVQGLWKSYTISRDQAYTKRHPKEHEVETFIEPDGRMWGWKEFSGEKLYDAKDVLRGDSVPDYPRLDPSCRAQYERPEGPEHYFDWDEMMMDTSDDA